MGQFIKDYPQFIYGADQEITALGQNGILDKASADALSTSAYNAFEPILLAQATTPVSPATATASSTTASTAATASSSAATAAAASSAAGLSAVAATVVIASSPLSPLKKEKKDKPYSISASKASIVENAGSAVTVTFDLGLPATTATTLNVTTAGTATVGTDYVLSATQITIPSGGKSGTVTITPTDDSVYEGNETVIVSTAEYSSYTSTITITDNESAPTISLSASAASVAENSGTVVTLTATSSQIADEAVTVTLAAAGTATLNTDFTVSASTITIPAGSTTGAITATATNDSVYEPDETAIISISSVSGADATENGNQSQTITITNDEAAPTVTFSVSANTIAENAGSTITLTATLSGATYETTTVNFTASGTSTLNDDYTVTTPITIAAGSTSGTATLYIVNDLMYETNETVILDVATVTGGGVTENGTQQQTITITNDDAAPTLTLASSASSMDENGSAVTLTVTLSNPTYQTVTVGLSTSGTATLNTDYTLSATSFTIAAGTSSGSVTATPTDDSTFEGDETVIIDVSSVSGGGATESGTQQVTVALKEDDAGPQLSINDVTTSDESAANATFTITSSVVSASNMTVNWATSNGTATAGSDYTAASGTATITAGQTTTTINVGVLADTTDEPNETVTITLSNPTLASISDATGTLTITDDDAAPAISIANVSRAENGGTATMTATLAAASGKAVTFDYATSNGTATAGSDYTAASGSLTIAAGQTTKTFTVAITDDTTDEVDETVTVSISNAVNTSNATASATLTITDNDNAPTLSIADAQSTNEASASTNLTVSLSEASAKAISVDWATSNGTATAGSDYTAASGTLSFAAGETTKTVAVAVIQDNTFEGNETVTITLTNPSNATIADATATLTITEDDVGPMLSINDQTVSESAGTATFTVTMSPTSASNVTVNYASGNPATATAGADYTAVSGSFTFTAGQSSKSITVTIANDSLDEADETATITLSGASGAGTSDATGLLTITDDDATPTISINSAASITEGDSGTSTQNMTATLSAVSGRDVTFNYAISAGTATSADFTAASGTFTISAGASTKTIPVSIIGDRVEENKTAETVIVTISSPTNATLSGTGIGTISITDNDGLNVGTTATYNAGDATAFLSATEFVQSDVGSTTWASDKTPYENINLHKALAYESGGVNVMGQGKIIAVMDEGFQVNGLGSNNRTHQEFSGKTIYYNNSYQSNFGTYSKYGLRHGTFVASIAAGNFGTGAMMGVAPNADLHLFDNTAAVKPAGVASMANWYAIGTDSAASAGAVVQNNSWGFDDSQTNNGVAYTAQAAVNTYVNYMNDNGLTGAQTLSAFASIDSDSNGVNDIYHAGTAAQWQTYIDSLNTYQNTGVVVFALSNNATFPDADVSAALPELFPQLEEAWLTVSNVNITGTGTQNFTLESAPCKSTAEYCLAADGTEILGAGGSTYSAGGFDYSNGSGTSYAAPQVSGAVALLASHFPNHTPAQWADRLLASANNNIGFSQTGSVTFGNGVVHGYSNEAGHGIMDIYAALQPIYTDSAARGIFAGARNLNGQRFNLVQSGLRGSRSFGDGLTNGVGAISSYFYDGLNGGFKYDISGHVSQVVETAKTVDLKNELTALDNPIKDRFELKVKMSFTGSAVDDTPDNDNQRFIATANAAAPAVQSFFDFGSTALASYTEYDTPYLATDEGGVGVTYAQNLGDTRILLSLNRPVEVGAGEEVKGKQHVAVMSSDTMISPSTHLGFMAGQASEKDGFLGLQGTEAFNLDNSESNTSFMGVKFGKMLGDELKFNAMATSGRSTMARSGDGIIRGASDVVSSSYGFSLEKANIFGSDSLAISLQQPNRVEQGRMSVITSNLSDSDGNLTYNNHNVSIVPSGRQKDLAIGYTKAVSDDLTISTKLIATDELNHVKSAKDAYSAFVGFKSGNIKMGTSAATHRKGFDAQINYSTKF
ncbi:S8 family serine peptidase [Alphaproteobacteria bacterium]|nr:S8 family serine peptidase [Alphaproteobacteria bacterium]